MENYIFLLLSVLSMVSISYQQTDNDYVVSVKFDKNEGELLELCEWNVNNASANFRNITAVRATEYCPDDTANGTVEGCDRRTFQSSDVVILNEPEEFNGDILIQTYVMGLSKEAFQTLLNDSRDDYKTGLADNSYAITLMFVDDVRVADPIDHSVDYIMIGVSIMILLAACFLALVLKCKESMAEKQKLEHYEGNRARSPKSQNKTEEVNLTTIKAPDEDSKDASEGSVNSWKNRVGPSNNNNRTQETQTTAKVAFVSDDNDPENEDPRGSIHTPREPGQMDIPYHGGDGTAPYMGGGAGSRGMQVNASQRGDVAQQPENLGHGEQGVTTNQGEGFVNNEGERAVYNGEEPSVNKGDDDVIKVVESSNLAQVKPTLPQRSSRHNILPPLGESAARDFSVEVKGGGNQGSTDGSDGEGASDKKQRKRKRKQKKRKNVSSDDEKNDLLDDSFQERALSPLGEEAPVVEM